MKYEIQNIGFKRFLPQSWRESFNEWFNGKGCFWISEKWINSNEAFKGIEADKTLAIRLFAIATVDALKESNSTSTKITFIDDGIEVDVSIKKTNL